MSDAGLFPEASRLLRDRASRVRDKASRTQNGSRPRASDGSLDAHRFQHLPREFILGFSAAVRAVPHVAALAREIAAAFPRRNTGRETLTHDKKKNCTSSWKLNHICCEAKTRSAYMYECIYIPMYYAAVFFLQRVFFITNICLSTSLKH